MLPKITASGPGIGTLDGRYVRKTGDTMSGTLTISNATTAKLGLRSAALGSLLFEDGTGADKWELYADTTGGTAGFYDYARSRDVWAVNASGNLTLAPSGGTVTTGGTFTSGGALTASTTLTATGAFTASSTAQFNALATFSGASGALLLNATVTSGNMVAAAGTVINSSYLSVTGSIQTNTAFTAILALTANFVPTVPLTGGSDQLYGMLFLPQVRDNAGVSNNVTSVYGQLVRIDTAGSYTGTITNVRLFSATNPSKAVGSTMTNVYGFFCGVLNAGATLNYAFYSEGTTQNYFGGATGFNRVTSIAGQVHIVPASSATIVAVIQGAASQSADLTQWRDTSGNSNAFIAASGAGTLRPRDAATNAVTTALTLGHNTSGTPAAGYGTGLAFQGESSTTEDQSMAAWDASWATATHASRKARVIGNVYDTAAREWIRGEADGSAAMIGFLGATAVVRQVSAANLTNNVTSGGTDDTIASFTDLIIYANDAATIRNNQYQLARKLKQVNDALRLYGLLT